MDRIDLHVAVMPVKYDEMTGNSSNENSATVRDRVQKARDIQKQRFKDENGIYCNAHMASRQTRKYCILKDEADALLKNAINHLGLSARAIDRILKVSRTIADLAGKEEIITPHVAEAIQYRTIDRLSDFS